MTAQLPSKERLAKTIEQLEHFATNLKWTNVCGAQTLLFAADGLRALLAAHEQEPVAKVDNIGVCWYADGGIVRKPPVGTELFTHPAPVPAVSDEMRNRLKAEGLAELRKDASEYAPLTAKQWETLAKNWHETFIGLADRYAELEAGRAAMLGNTSVIAAVPKEA